MKHLTSILLLLAVVASLLTGCSDAPVPETPATEPPVTEEILTEAPTEPATQAPAQITEAPADDTEIPETTEPASTESPVPYLQRIPYADQSIYNGPGYDYCFAGTVKEAGTYTIVEEAWDVEDNLWGRLKSGAGWVDLTDIRSEQRKAEPLRANYADDRLLKSGDYHHFVGCDTEYAVQVAFRANETLTDVRLYSMEFYETMELAEELYHLPLLEPGKPFVADLDFPGDMSTYAILFTDASGNQRYCTVYMSMRNGALILTEHTE